MKLNSKVFISKNLTGLYLLHGLNAISPLIIFPWVLYILGPEKYSLIIVGEAIMFISQAISLYGFEINGIQKLIEDEEGNFNVIFKIRLILLIICFLILVVVCHLLTLNLLVIGLWLLCPLAFIIQNNYIFLHKEDNWNLFLRVLPGRTMCLILIFSVLTKESEPWLVPLIIGGSYFISSLLVFKYLILKFKYKFSSLQFDDIRKSLKMNKHIFLGSISVLLLKDLNVIIIDQLSNSSRAVSIYSIAEKITRFFQASIRPLNQFYFKKGVVALQKFSSPSILIISLLKKLIFPQVLFLLILATISFTLFSLGLFDNFTQNGSVLFYSLLIFMIPATFVGVLNYMLGNLGLNHLGKEKYYAKAIIISGLMSLLITGLLTYNMNEQGTAISFLISEIILFMIIIKSYLERKK